MFHTRPVLSLAYFSISATFPSCLFLFQHTSIPTSLLGKMRPLVQYWDVMPVIRRANHFQVRLRPALQEEISAWFCNHPWGLSGTFCCFVK